MSDFLVSQKESGLDQDAHSISSLWASVSYSWNQRPVYSHPPSERRSRPPRERSPGSRRSSAESSTGAKWVST